MSGYVPGAYVASAMHTLKFPNVGSDSRTIRSASSMASVPIVSADPSSRPLNVAPVEEPTKDSMDEFVTTTREWCDAPASKSVVPPTSSRTLSSDAAPESVFTPLPARTRRPASPGLSAKFCEMVTGYADSSVRPFAPRFASSKFSTNPAEDVCARIVPPSASKTAHPPPPFAVAPVHPRTRWLCSTPPSRTSLHFVFCESHTFTPLMLSVVVTETKPPVMRMTLVGPVALPCHAKRICGVVSVPPSMRYSPWPTCPTSRPSAPAITISPPVCATTPVAVEPSPRNSPLDGISSVPPFMLSVPCPLRPMLICLPDPVALADMCVPSSSMVIVP